MSSILPTCIDVSYYQGNISWDTVKPSCWLAIIRIQDGTFLDPKLSHNVQECERLGIPYYLYFFYRNGGAVEAARAVSRARAAGIKSCRGFVVDLEISGYSKANLRSAFATLNASGLDNGLYLANHLYSEYGGESYGEKWRWIPKYGINDGKPHTKPAYYCDLWQFTSVGEVPGISGGCDCNALSGNRMIDDFTGPIKEVVPLPSHANVSLPDYILLGNTLAGMYGNGQGRRNNLGVKYDEIQALVNHICTAPTSTLVDEVIAGKYGNCNDRRRALGTRYDEVQAKINSKLGISGQTKKALSEIAKDVIDGKYGNGQDRVKKLESEGYDADEVQQEVNRQLGAAQSGVYYTIKSGDTLSSIAAKYGTTYTKIAMMNGIQNPDFIYSGQRIRVR